MTSGAEFQAVLGPLFVRMIGLRIMEVLVHTPDATTDA